MISVVMPVYNREKYVGAAIESILAQTFTDFEFIIVDDGSTDHSLDVVKSYPDPRIRLIQMPKNQGISAARNAGNELARGEFIAVMDSDDIALPRRLERQLAYLRKHPEVGLCGASNRRVDNVMQPLAKPLREFRALTEHEACRAELLFGMPFTQATFLARREVYRQLHYDPHWETAEDHAFLARAAQFTRLGGLREVLLLTRHHPERATLLQAEGHKKRCLHNGFWVLSQIGLPLTDEERALWGTFCTPEDKNVSCIELKSIDVLCQRILEANRTSAFLGQRSLHDTIARRW
jgi:glycosyltransferase involved in cell wall biosynthesis